MKVVDFGLSKSTRRMPRTRQTDIIHVLATPPPPHLARTSKNEGLEDRKNKNKNMQDLEVEKNNKKIEENQKKLQVKKKKTFDKLVKTVSTPRRPAQDKNLPQSTNLKRLKTPILAKTAARTSLLSPKPENFQGLRNFF